MTDLPQPTPVQLGPSGPYITPEVRTFSGPGAAEGKLPMRFGNPTAPAAPLICQSSARACTHKPRACPLSERTGHPGWRE